MHRNLADDMFIGYTRCSLYDEYCGWSMHIPSILAKMYGAISERGTYFLTYYMCKFIITKVSFIAHFTNFYHWSIHVAMKYTCLLYPAT